MSVLFGLGLPLVLVLRLARRQSPETLAFLMDLTAAERPIVRRAIAAYKAKKAYEGPFQGITADEVLEELKPSPVRWAALAAFVIEQAEGPTRRT